MQDVERNVLLVISFYFPLKKKKKSTQDKPKLAVVCIFREVVICSENLAEG